MLQEAENGWRDVELVSVFCAMVRQPDFAYLGSSPLAGQGLGTAGDEDSRRMRESLVRMSREVLR
jgi:hypothetical protein